MAVELSDNEIPFQVQAELPVRYKNELIDAAYKIDVLVNKELIIELKSVEKTFPIHEAQLLTYMKLAKIERGLLINFNVRLLKDGIKRLVL